MHIFAIPGSLLVRTILSDTGEVTDEETRRRLRAVLDALAQAITDAEPYEVPTIS